MEALREKILIFKPKVLCFNGKTAAQVFMGRKDIDYGLQDMKIGKTLVYVAPSTSGAASGFWDEKYYVQLALILNKGKSGLGDENERLHIGVC